MRYGNIPTNYEEEIRIEFYILEFQKAKHLFALTLIDSKNTHNRN